MRKTLLIIPAAMIIFSGCVQQKQGVYADFVMPPKKIKNINEIKNIKINVKNVQLSGVPKKFKVDIARMLEGKFASSIFKEQFLDVADPNLESKNLSKLSKIAFNHHGYEQFSCVNSKTARLDLSIKVNKRIKKDIDDITLRLARQSYKVKYTKGDYPAPISVPEGRPSYTTVNKKVPYTNFNLNVDLDVKLYGINGELLYENSFNNIAVNEKIGGDTLKVKTHPTDLELIALAVSDKIKKVVKDISPYKETRALHVNEKGNKTAVTLMKATAFNDAAYALDEYISKTEAEIEKQEQEIEKKYSEKIAAAKEEKEKESLMQNKKAEISNLYVVLSPEYENMGILNEILGDIASAYDYYSTAFEYDSKNTSAEKSMKRVETLIKKQKELAILSKDIDVKHIFKNKENKDR